MQSNQAFATNYSIMKTVRFLLPLLFLLTIGLSLRAQDVTILYERVDGLVTDQIRVYMTNNTGAPIDLGAVNISVAYNTANVTYDNISFSLFEDTWGTGSNIDVEGSNTAFLIPAKNYGGNSYDTRVWYLASKTAGTPAITLAASGAPMLHVMTVDFTVINPGSSRYMETNGEFFGNRLDDVGGTLVPFLTQDLSTPFPVEWLSFEAEQVGTEKVGLVWVTATEQNNAFFGIERSIDGMSFEQIGTVEGMGNSNDPRTYDYLDRNAAADRLYYRLRQVDIDGVFTYSEVREVRLDQTFGLQISLYPNPASETLFLQSTEEVSGSFEIKMLDATGRLIQQVRTETFGQQDLAFPVSQLANGVYSLEVRNLETFEVKSKMFVKK